MIHRDVTFNGISLVDGLGLHYSSFAEDLPQPKVSVVDIPYGTDVDVTDALGPVAFANGKQTLVFMCYGDTEAERLDKKRAAINALNGVRADYVLSWDPDYIYTGRASVQIAHVFENADVLTVTIDRTPYRVTQWEEPDSSSSMDYANYSYIYFPVLSGSKAYDIRVTHRAATVLQYKNVTVATYDEQTGMRVEPVERVTGSGQVRVQVSGFDWYYAANSVKVPEATLTDTDIALGSTWSLSGHDIRSSGVNGTPTVEVRGVDI